MEKCIVCKKEKEYTEQIFKKGTSIGDENDFYNNPRYICTDCLKKSGEYGTCCMCDGTGVYHMSDLYDENLCKEHFDETRMDEEEEEGWNDIIENWNNN